MPDRDNLKAGERRTAALLFSDMKGFTALSEHMDPEEVDVLMSRVFGIFEEIIRSHGGIVEKYIGDALVAIFGVPEIHEDDASRAVHAALEFLDRVREIEASLGKKDIRLSFRTGVHEGLIATGQRGEYRVVTGHAMSVAQRLEAAAAPNTILVSEAVRDKCSAEFTFSDPLELSVKGKREALRAFEVRGLAMGESHDEGPFVGRAETLEALLKSYLRADTSGVSGFFLLGDAGIGKTRTAQAFIEKIRRFPDFSAPILTARAQKYRSIQYSVVLDLILDYLSLNSRSSAESIEKSLRVLPGVSALTARRFSELAASKAAAGQDSVAVMTLFEIFSSIMERHGGGVYPVLVLVDTANYMDRFSRDFFQYFFRNGRIKPFLLLTGRDFPTPLRDAFQALKPLHMGPLSPEESRELLYSLWPDCPEKTSAQVLSSGAGNPLFLKEYAAFARKHKDESTLPDTIQTIYLSSLERYDPEARDLLRKLSAFVHSFTEEDARYIQERTQASPEIAELALPIFLRDGILVREGEEYTFRQDVFKKALYASLLNHNKRVLHGIIADILLRQERPNRIRLIGHLVRAERYQEAARVLQSDLNRNYTYEYLEYLDILYKRLAREDPDAAVPLLITKSSLLFNSGKMDEAEEELKRILRLAVTRRNDNCMGFAYHQICAYNVLTRSFQKALFTGQKALYYYRKAQLPPRSVQNVMRHIASAHIQLNEFEEARRLADEMQAMTSRDEYELASLRAEYSLYRGDYRGSLATVDRALGALDAEHSAARFFALDLKIESLWQLCDFSAILPTAQELLGAGSLSSTVLSKAHARRTLAEFYTEGSESVRDGFLQAEFYADQIKNDFERIEALGTLALCHYLAGNARKAEAIAAEAVVLGLRHSCYYPTFTLLMILVELREERGKDSEARFFLREASYFFTTGLLLPAKDVILYYWFASKYPEFGDSKRSLTIAGRLLEEEMSRLEDPDLKANFLATRSFARLQRDVDGLS